MYSPLPDFPHLALCIATVGRIRELDRLLTSLEQQTCTDFHIYLADQNAPGTLDAMLQKHADLQITRILLPSRGVSIARNALLSLVEEEEVIIFPDDDCWYALDTLAQVVEAFRRHPEAGAVLGYWAPSPQLPQPDNTEQVLSSTALFSQGGTCVQFFRAEAVKDLRFDPRLGPGTGLPYGCGEDTDYLLEAHKRAPVWRCPSIRVFHPCRIRMCRLMPRLPATRPAACICSRNMPSRSGSAVPMYSIPCACCQWMHCAKVARPHGIAGACSWSDFAIFHPEMKGKATRYRVAFPHCCRNTLKHT